MKHLLKLLLLSFVFVSCKKDGEDAPAVPEPGTTRQFTVDALTRAEGSIVRASSDRSCSIAYGAEFPIDPHAVSYTVKFTNRVRSGGAIIGTVNDPDVSYNFTHAQAVEVLNGPNASGDVYTNWYSVGNLGSVTKITPQNKYHVNIGWCAGNGICNPGNSCQTVTAKATVTVHY